MFLKEKVLDSVTRVAGESVGVLSGARKAVKEDIKSRILDFGDRMDFVPREDFELLKTMIRELREKQDDLAARLKILESNGKSGEDSKA